MYGIEETCSCPICHTEYQTTPKTCACGFEGLFFMPLDGADTQREALTSVESKLLFRIFKFAKQVYYGEKPYEKSETVLYRRENYVAVEEAVEERGLAFVDVAKSEDDPLPTVAVSGILASRSNIHALILNVNEARCDFLEECSARILLLGADVQGFTEGGFQQFRSLRYIWTDQKNKWLTAEDNVLFNKRKTKLIAYAGDRPGEDYTVPPDVKELAPYCFFFPTHLRRLHLPRGIRVDHRAILPNTVYEYVDEKTTKTKPSIEIIYYNPNQ